MLLENLEAIISMLDYTLDTKRKRHLVGGVLLSVSLLFGGLAFTTLTLKEEKKDEKPNYIHGGNSNRSSNGVFGSKGPVRNQSTGGSIGSQRSFEEDLSDEDGGWL